jgi:hypothetical protein
MRRPTRARLIWTGLAVIGLAIAVTWLLNAGDTKEAECSGPSAAVDVVNEGPCDVATRQYEISLAVAGVAVGAAVWAAYELFRDGSMGSSRHGR